MSSTDAIVTRGLTKTFRTVRAVDDVDLRVRPGEVVGFIGPDGAGKTTVLRLLVGLLRPTSGTPSSSGSTRPVTASRCAGTSGTCPASSRRSRGLDLVLSTPAGSGSRLLYGGMALGLGAATGRRGVRLATAAGSAGAGFLYTSIAPFVDVLSGAAGLSPFQLVHGTQPVRTGWRVADLVALVAGALLLVAAGTLRFERRDVH